MLPLRRIIVLLIASFFIMSLTKNIMEYRKNLAFYQDYKNEYLKEKKHNEELKTEYVKTQDVYEFEKTVRNRLNLHKKNEVVLIVPEATPTIAILPPTPIPNYQQWVDIFFKN
ncbi:septum formation initiator family protein [Candidatus Woesebacteria bacterium]|nr:septum formation initiator family protein [Candidatus Woesebacteria bacterium]